MINTLENTKGVTNNTFETVVNSLPEWIRDHKRNAWETFQNLSNQPLKKEKFKDVIDSLELENISFKNEFAEPSDFSLPKDYWGTLNGFFAINGKSNFLNEELQKKGVILKSLKDALVENEELVKPYLLKANLTAKDSRFTALAEAMWSDGVFLYVPKNIDVSLPIHILKWVNEANSQNYYKSLVVVEEGSVLTVVDEFTSKDTKEFFLVDGINEIHIKNSANVTYLHLQNYDYNAFNFSLQKTVLERDAQLKLMSVSLGSQFSYENIRTYAEGEGSNSKILGLVVGDKEQIFQHQTLQYHPVPAAMSDLHFEVMLKDKAESAHNGFVEIEKIAKKTDAHQLIRNLLLSRKAKAEAIPNLEILADDVKCSHGVSLGPVNFEELFYLNSRGFSKEEAQNLIIEGSIENLVNEFQDKTMEDDHEDEDAESNEVETLGTKVRDYILNTLRNRI